MYDIVLEELTCFETMNSTLQISILCSAVFVSIHLSHANFPQLWYLVAAAYYFKIYKSHDVVSDSVEGTIQLILFIKAAQMSLALLSYSLCDSESVIDIMVQKLLLIFLLIAETVTRANIAGMFYIIANVSSQFEFLLNLLKITGLGNS